MSRKQSRRFSMTMNNYNADDIVIIKERWLEVFKYVIFGKEIGEQLTPHLQMYGETVGKITINGLKAKLNLINPRFNQIHIETSAGTAAQNITYCSKDGNFEEIGIKPTGQGHRSDLSAVVDSIKSGASLSSIIDEHGESFIKYGRGISDMFYLYQNPRNFMTIGYWLYGTTGTGKSRWAHEKFPGAYWKDADTKWFDGYKGEETVILDDFRPTKELTFQMILRLVDRYPMKVQVKGGYVNFAPKRIIVTTPKCIQQTFTHLEWIGDESLEQLHRRFPHQMEFRTDNFQLLMNLNLEG